MDEESYSMNGGHDDLSYAKNSNLQRCGASSANDMIKEVIMKKFDMKGFLHPSSASSTTPTILVADFGCSTGPNTFIAMQYVVDIIKSKCESLKLKQPQFQVSFNDQTSNDFNTLFMSLPHDRDYFSAGVPGSFRKRLFPDRSLHLVHSAISLHWISKLPTELVDIESPLWNRGRIHYGNVPDGVREAYARQFTLEFGMFLDARAQELVDGGMMLLIIPSVPAHLLSSVSCASITFMYELLGYCLVDMAQAGVLTEEQVDSFNLPLFFASTREIEDIVEKNGRFCIQVIESLSPPIWFTTLGVNNIRNALRASMEDTFAKHFGKEHMNELFDRFSQKINDMTDAFKLCTDDGAISFVALVKN